MALEAHIANLKDWSAQFGRRFSSISLVGGFVFDAVTLKRVDMLRENFWVLVHLLLAAACIVLINRLGDKAASAVGPSKIHFWLINLMQFCFGGLLSTFLVFYFRSGSLWVSWPFFLILGAAFVANEKLKKHYARLDFQIVFFSLSLFSFDIFILPVVLHSIGPFIFLLSGAMSLLLLAGFLRILKSTAGDLISRSTKTLFVSIAGVFVVISGMYFLNLIPPLPLSLQDASVQHSVAKNADGNYVVQHEDQGWLGFFRRVEQFHWAPGAPVYAYSAVFSPTSLNTDVVHEWQMYETQRGWVTMDRIKLPLIGGRGGGYRTYSMKTAMRPGAWRVNVETPSGAMLGRLRFNVILQADSPALTTEIKD